MDRSGNASISNRTVPGDGILVMGDENAILCPRKPEHFGIGSTVESGREGALKIYGGFVAQHTGADRIAEVVIGLEPRLQLFRASGMERFARVSEALAQVLRQGRRSSSRSFEAARAGLLQFAPVAFVHVNVVLLRGRFDSLPGRVAFVIADALHLIESCDGVPYMGGVMDRLFAFLGEGELSACHLVSLRFGNFGHT